jgi:hypothetical protein
MHDAILNEYRSDQQKKYISKELRPHAMIICVFYAEDGVRSVAEQFKLQNSSG